MRGFLLSRDLWTALIQKSSHPHHEEILPEELIMQGNGRIIIQQLEPNNTLLCLSAWQCYQVGFAGPPWNEWKKCSSCDTHFGIDMEDTDYCPICSKRLEQFWPINQISSDILGSLKLPFAHCAVAVIGTDVVGLLLGYAISSCELSSHLGLYGENYFSTLDVGLVAYSDDIVVRPEWRGKGVGRMLHDSWADWIYKSGLKHVIVRTLSDPPTVIYNWYQRIGYYIVAKYPEPDKRVILHLSM